MNNKKRNGYVLAITIVVTFVITLTVVTLLSLVYRYSNTASKSLETLRETVKDYPGFNK